MNPVVILLPGMVCNRAIWAPQIEALEPRWSVRVASYPLHDSIGAMAESVLASAPRRFAVAGHSMGGRVALEIVTRAPDRVAGLALLGTDFRAPRDAAERETEARARSQDIEQINRDGFPAFAEAWARKLIAAHRREEYDLIRTIAGMARRQGIKSLEAHALAGVNRPDYTDLLGNITCPTLICAADEDAARPVGPHRAMAERIADSHLVILEKCGHMMTLECAAAVSTAMLDWLASIERW
jgi:pimeloyl-ACP methyl ester carboxylesterase